MRKPEEGNKKQSTLALGRWRRHYAWVPFNLYQQTVGELSNSCSRVDWEAIPFYPTPFDAPAACSCNLGQLTVSLKRLIGEAKSCTDKIGDLAGHNPEDVIETYLCCQTSGLSINWIVCVDMNPSLSGADDWYNLVPLDNFLTCGNYMDDISCVGDLGFPPPGADKSAKFYAPGEFPKNGTETTISNLDGSITSPLSGETFSWTLGAIEHTVIVASVDAKLTGSTGGDKADENEDSDEDDEDDVASLLSPQLWLIALICLILV